MKVAYLFLDKYPSYDAVCNLISKMTIEELFSIKSYIKSGLWGFEGIGNSFDMKIREKQIINTIITSEGNVYGFNNSHNTFDKLFTSPIYVVQIDSIRKDLATRIHNKLLIEENYLGFTEVLLTNKSHLKAFTGYAPIAKLDNKSVDFLYDEQSEFMVDELIEWFKSKYPAYSTLIKKREIGYRFSLLDKYNSDSLDKKIDNALYLIRDEWQITTQELFYQLMDINPEIVEELVSAIEKFDIKLKSPSDVAQFTVNIRRALEKVIDTINPSASNTEQQNPKKRYQVYINNDLTENKFYKDYLDAELVEIYTRLEKIYNITNKGIHEDWLDSILSNLIMRTILLISDIVMPKKLKKSAIFYESAVFE